MKQAKHENSPVIHVHVANNFNNFSVEFCLLVATCWLSLVSRMTTVWKLGKYIQPQNMGFVFAWIPSLKLIKRVVMYLLDFYET